jgi:DNA-binding transcriptional regulator YiaG
MDDLTEKIMDPDAEIGLGDVLMDTLTDESAPLPNIGMHLFMVRVSMKLSPKRAATMLGMTQKQLQDYEVGTKAPTGEHRKNILQFINRLAPQVGMRGRDN